MAKTSFRTLELLLTYFQKSEGLFLTLLARLVSNDDLASLSYGSSISTFGVQNKISLTPCGFICIPCLVLSFNEF